MMGLAEFTTETLDGIRSLGIETQSDPIVRDMKPVKDLGYCKVLPIDIEFSNLNNAAAFVHEAGYRFGDSVLSHANDTGSLVITLNVIIKGYVTL